jgi:hypothetical protein
MKRPLLPALLLSIAMTAPLPALASEKHDYPTMDRYQWIQECIAQQGAADFVTVHACGCAIDVIAEKMPHDQFVAADTAEKSRGLSGSSAVYLRDPGISIRDLRGAYGQAKYEANRRCFVKPNEMKNIWPVFD